MLEKPLLKMALGGVGDRRAGGFHRYSVDEWLVPHFDRCSTIMLLPQLRRGLSADKKPKF